MTLAAEQIAKELLRKGITLSVTANGDLALDGMTGRLTEDDLQDLRLHKTDLVRYLTDAPLGTTAMYVAMDLEHWITTEPYAWADRIGITGKTFIRLTPSAVAWLRDRVEKAEVACEAHKLPVEAFGRIVRAFDRVYSFAVRTGLVRPSDALARELDRLESLKKEGAA